MKDPTPCTQWAEQLPIRSPEDFSPTERETFERHLAECAQCAAARQRYRFLAARVRALPAVQPLPDLTLQFLQAKERSVMNAESPDLIESCSSSEADHKGRLSQNPIEKGLAVLVTLLIILLAYMLFQKPMPLRVIASLIQCTSDSFLSASSSLLLCLMSAICGLVSIILLYRLMIRRRRKSLQSLRTARTRVPAFLIALLLLDILSVFASLWEPLASPAGSLQGGAQTPMMAPSGESIGISDGSYAFDTNRPGGDLKIQAAEYLQKRHIEEALSSWSEELDKDASDAEALIYLENQHVLASSKPYITLVIGVTLTSKNNTATIISREILQGAYIAQKEYNDTLKPDEGKLLRLLIANSGSDPNNATRIAQQIVQAAKQDKTIIGVLGWPSSAQTLNAVKVLPVTNIPIVSPTASSDELTGISPNFFRIVPPNKMQAIAAAHYAEQQLGARRVAVFVDSDNLYSRSLADDFTTQFLNDGNQIVDAEEYKVGYTKNFPWLLQKALGTNPDLIYFAGDSSDLTKLLELRPDLQVMGGDALYELGGYSNAARDFTHLYFTSFAYPDEWAIQGRPAPPFFTQYAQNFDPFHQHDYQYGSSRLTSRVMLSYDAMQALLKGYTNALIAGQIPVTPQALGQGLAKIYGDQAIQGVTGQISFGRNGDPVNKTIVVLHFQSGYIRLAGGHGIQGCFLLGECKNTN